MPTRTPEETVFAIEAIRKKCQGLVNCFQKALGFSILGRA